MSHGTPQGRSATIVKNCCKMSHVSNQWLGWIVIAYACSENTTLETRDLQFCNSPYNLYIHAVDLRKATNYYSVISGPFCICLAAWSRFEEHFSRLLPSGMCQGEIGLTENEICFIAAHAHLITSKSWVVRFDIDRTYTISKYSKTYSQTYCIRRS